MYSREKSGLTLVIGWLKMTSSIFVKAPCSITASGADPKIDDIVYKFNHWVLTSGLNILWFLCRLIWNSYHGIVVEVEI